ncbi:MAG: hypothetical protein J0M12_05240 [Deltaproteobacteria bacterium]|nr:hypothetical protein [Deltaproteobacteria bacterium]
MICSALVVPYAASAAPRSVPCPEVIGDKDSQLFFPGRYFRCYQSKRDARRSGFISPQTLGTRDFTGWWRFGLKPVKNTCPNTPIAAGQTTVFLQIKQTEAGLFAGMCPGEPKFVGKSLLNEGGFSLATSETLRNDPDCGGGDAHLQYSFEALRLSSDTNSAGAARLARVKSCASPEHGTFSCTTEWVGSGGREKPDHRFWPIVSENVNSFGETCAEALTLCSGCHG